MMIELRIRGLSKLCFPQCLIYYHLHMLSGRWHQCYIKRPVLEFIHKPPFGNFL